MKNTIFIILCSILILSTSCNEKKSNYALDWQDNNLCVIMPHPTMGIVTPGLIDWRGVELSEVVEDICNEFKNTDLSGDVSVWVRFEKPEHDKYGNETMSYDDHFLTTIPISEGKKFKSGNYLDMEYHLKDLIIQSAFPTDIYSPYGTVTVPQNTYSGGYSNTPTNQTTQEEFTITPITSPADTANTNETNRMYKF